MSNTTLKKSLSIAMGATFAAAMTASPLVNAGTNPFGMQSMPDGYMQLAEGKCGANKMKKSKDAKCGANKMKKEGKCGEGKCGANKMKKSKDMKCGANKGKEAKCGANKMKKEGKCGEKHNKKMEGKCGGMK